MSTEIVTPISAPRIAAVTPQISPPFCF
ncbi:hypothetical protein CPAR01_02452 [Colletotrichum paranaense]|uniref:Uncharacterized protein n=6 Tax=Colletotrichum acutatum species complex TaxID=2707335 RepID=A0A9P9X1W3_9PEZI|nr:hypothetical protein CABS02_14235 [Colletotrichum abscissum]KAI3541988.1 hypothetical protein CSPX01_07215 [Colletotrichum filicis]KAK0372340.1 hypothetical protein CLIM01_10292 [Colletotrichum limetticola]KAK1460154.1 hypothetical protein CMEL01_03153 [Colletotrichum melonis]KAK1476835.1 hypothetical protein CTAM01_15316 [Colletotrichum tamarilloi]KAK1544950.1 hypothetical protein CPAR01_02452 [Colletotrichum paranaense]UQC75433.1 hypothetical protein CLUP02_02087 [Colletotrichum lupini]